MYKARLPVAVSQAVHEPVEALMEGISEKVGEVEGQAYKARMHVAVSQAVHEPVVNTDTAASSSDRHLALCTPAADPWVQVRHGAMLQGTLRVLRPAPTNPWAYNVQPALLKNMPSKRNTRNAWMDESRSLWHRRSLAACLCQPLRHARFAVCLHAS